MGATPLSSLSSKTPGPSTNHQFCRVLPTRAPGAPWDPGEELRAPGRPALGCGPCRGQGQAFPTLPRCHPPA